MEMNKIVLGVWIYIIAYLSAVYGVFCTCGNIEENRTVNCECSITNSVELFYNDSRVSGCYSKIGACIPATWMGTKFTYTSTGLKISISNFKPKDCKLYIYKDSETLELEHFPYCPVLTMTKPDNNGPINIVENTSAEFICTIRSGYPAGIVMWYTDSGTPSNIDDVEITYGITTSSAQSPTDNQEYTTTSTLKFSPSRLYTDSRIYCTGTNKPEQTPLTSQRKPLLNILYYSAGPSIEEGTSYRVIENMLGQMSCVISGGNPAPTLNWNCNGGTQTSASYGERKTRTVIWRAHRENSDTCICESTQTGLQSRTATTQVTVLYPPSSPDITVNGQQVAGDILFIENRSQQIKCESIGNPKPTIDWEKRVGSSATPNGQFLNFTKILKTDAGLYTCTASNVMDPTGRHPLTGTNTSYTEIVILCIPRPASTVTLNRTSETNETFTFTFNAIAYPFPVFIWKKWYNDGWKNVQNDTNVNITSSDLQSNLTIHRVNQGDFGKYLLVVRNDIGVLELSYQLDPYVEPDEPTNFVHIERLATESSIQLEWKPRFNGGPPQTFYIKYKSSNSECNFVSIPDNGEQTMQYQLSGLESDTLYQLIIYSSNRMGNSSESELLITKTKGINKSNSAPMIGGVVGGLVILAVIVVAILFIVRRYQIRKGIPNSGAETTTREVQEASQITSEPTYYNDGSIPDYETLNQQNRDFTTYSSLQQNSSSLTNDNSSGENKTYQNIQLRVI